MNSKIYKPSGGGPEWVGVVGATTLLLEGLSPEKMLAAIEQHRATVVFTAPTLYRQMAGLASRFDLKSLRACVSAGEALPDTTRQLWREASGIEMIGGIGSTELIHIFISSAGSEVRRGAAWCGVVRSVRSCRAIRR